MLTSKSMLAGVATLVAGSTLLASSTASAIDCTGEPMFLTNACVDPHYTQPYIDIDQQRTTPAPHRYVHGGFTGTDTRFSIYLPPAAQYQGRFFQNTHQLIASENAADNTVGFALASGAYYVQSNIGGNERCTNTECAVFGGLDPTIGGYRANAAAAQFSKTVAQGMYGPHVTYGYLYGGSGGAYQTISSSEHSLGVWHGYVPFVMGSPQAIPNMFTVRINALRILRQRNKFPEIMDAIDPGGSGNPLATLNEEEKGAYLEALRMGFPPRGWWNHATLTGGPLALVAGYVPYLDPTYTNDFFTKPGYLGHDDPYGTLAPARFQDPPSSRTVVAVNPPGLPGFIILNSAPAGDLTGADLFVDSGPLAGRQFAVLTAFPTPIGPAILALGAALTPGTLVHLDNSGYLALQTYHRHQVSTPDFYGWNQFRAGGKPNGAPIYPQRDILIGPIGAVNGAGSLQEGNFNGKMIALESMVDIDALPWNADWYRTKVIQKKGKKQFENSFRLWFHDFAQHTNAAATNLPAQARIASYQGALEQSLRDVAKWAEQGVKPPSSTHYFVDKDTQVQLPPLLGLLRGGIQPVATLVANGRERADIHVGDTVTFHALVNLPPGTGKVVAAEWDFLGVGNYPVQEPVGDLLQNTVILKQTFTYTTPGTYFPVLRATSQREGDPATPWARVQNLARVRVVVQ